MVPIQARPRFIRLACCTAQPEDGGPGYSDVAYAFDIAQRKETVLHGFDFSDGVLPNALFSDHGMLYGATRYGDGTGRDGHGSGVLFEIDPATGAYTNIHILDHPVAADLVRATPTRSAAAPPRPIR